MVDWDSRMGGAMPPLQKQMKMKEEPSEMMSVEEAPMTKSTPWRTVRREEKKKLVQKTGPGQGSTTMLPQQRTLNERRNNYARPRHSI